METRYHHVGLKLSHLVSPNKETVSQHHVHILMTRHHGNYGLLSLNEILSGSVSLITYLLNSDEICENYGLIL